MQGTTSKNLFLEVTDSNGPPLGMHSKGSELRTLIENIFKKQIFFQIRFLI
jgi:hypothetical protein